MAVKIITCPWCGKEARITYEEDRVYQMKCYECKNTMLHVDHSFDSAAEFFEHNADLLQAEQDGRMVVLPCKVGDTAYWIHNGIITECRVHRIQMNRTGLFICLKSKVSHGAFRVDICLGKTVFLSREEAEEALSKEPTKRVSGRTFDIDGPGVPGVIYDCDNRPCKSRNNTIASFVIRRARYG